MPIDKTYSAEINGIDLGDINITLLEDTHIEHIGYKESLINLPGLHGAIDLSKKKSEKMIELSLAINGDTIDEFLAIKEQLLQLIDPTKPPLELIITDNPDIVFYVRYSGVIDLREWIKDAFVTIPFIRTSPYSFEKTSKEVIGATVTLSNEGTEPTDLIIEIDGPASEPKIFKDSDLRAEYGDNFTGKLIINGGTDEVTLEGLNAWPNLFGILPKVPPGESNWNCTSGESVKWKWREKYSI